MTMWFARIRKALLLLLPLFFFPMFLRGDFGNEGVGDLEFSVRLATQAIRTGGKTGPMAEDDWETVSSKFRSSGISTISELSALVK